MYLLAINYVILSSNSCIKLNVGFTWSYMSERLRLLVTGVYVLKCIQTYSHSWTLSMRLPEAQSTCSLTASLSMKKLLTIVCDQPLILCYNDCYLPVAHPQDEARSKQYSRAEILSEQRMMKIGNLATVGSRSLV